MHITRLESTKKILTKKLTIKFEINCITKDLYVNKLHIKYDRYTIITSDNDPYICESNSFLHDLLKYTLNR